MKRFILLLLVSVSSWSQEITPTERVYASFEYKDDLDFQNLPKAIERQLASFEERGLKGTIRFGTKTYPKSVVKDSLLLLKQYSEEATACLSAQAREVCEAEFSKNLNDSFAVYRPIPKAGERGFKEKKTYFTSYYTPDFRGSYEKTGEYKNPIFSLPQTEQDRTLSRVEIDFDRKLDGKGLELLWVRETLFDIYFMHIQGGGRVVLPDGSTTYLSYAGKNGKKFEFVSKYLNESGLMEKEKTNYYTQRAFLEEHPQYQRQTYATSPSFIFFKETSVEPHGLDDISLTEGRSLAWDNTVYKTLGVINFVRTVKTTHLDENDKPVKAPFSRFFLAQDTGGAIRGHARVDLYWGYGEEALFVAGKLMELGEQYFLIKK